LVALGFASGLTMRGSLRLFTLMRVSDYVGVFFLIGFAAALPEIFVAIFSAFFGAPVLSYGNILGANLADLTLVLGLAAYFSGGLKIDNHFSRKTFWTTVVLSFLPIIVALDGMVSRADGILLLVIFCMYAWIVILDIKFILKAISAVPFSVFHVKDAIKSFKESTVGHILLAVSTALLVIASMNISGFYSVNAIYFGIVFLGLATTLTELFLNTEAGVLRSSSLVMGAVLGSIAINSTAVLGLLAIISPIKIRLDPLGLLINACFLLVAFILFRTLAYTGKKVSREEGVVLVLIYVLFFISQLYFL
ncbi:MAG: hypothetical protein AAB965_03035, partial [Patescibacteria group bacterium]